MDSLGMSPIVTGNSQGASAQSGRNLEVVDQKVREVARKHTLTVEVDSSKAGAPAANNPRSEEAINQLFKTKYKEHEANLMASCHNFHKHPKPTVNLSGFAKDMAEHYIVNSNFIPESLHGYMVRVFLRHLDVLSGDVNNLRRIYQEAKLQDLKSIKAEAFLDEDILKVVDSMTLYMLKKSYTYGELIARRMLNSFIDQGVDLGSIGRVEMYKLIKTSKIIAHLDLDGVKQLVELIKFILIINGYLITSPQNTEEFEKVKNSFLTNPASFGSEVAEVLLSKLMPLKAKTLIEGYIHSAFVSTMNQFKLIDLFNTDHWKISSKAFFDVFKGKNLCKGLKTSCASAEVFDEAMGKCNKASKGRAEKTKFSIEILNLLKSEPQCLGRNLAIDFEVRFVLSFEGPLYEKTETELIAHFTEIMKTYGIVKQNKSYNLSQQAFLNFFKEGNRSGHGIKFISRQEEDQAFFDQFGFASTDNKATQGKDETNPGVKEVKTKQQRNKEKKAKRAAKEELKAKELAEAKAKKELEAKAKKEEERLSAIAKAEADRKAKEEEQAKLKAARIERKGAKKAKKREQEIAFKEAAKAAESTSSTKKADDNSDSKPYPQIPLANLNTLIKQWGGGSKKVGGPEQLEDDLVEKITPSEDKNAKSEFVRVMMESRVAAKKAPAEMLKKLDEEYNQTIEKFKLFEMDAEKKAQQMIIEMTLQFEKDNKATTLDVNTSQNQLASGLTKAAQNVLRAGEFDLKLKKIAEEKELNVKKFKTDICFTIFQSINKLPVNVFKLLPKEHQLYSLINLSLRQ